jgi:hypothetical protein
MSVKKLRLNFFASHLIFKNATPLGGGGASAPFFPRLKPCLGENKNYCKKGGGNFCILLCYLEKFWFYLIRLHQMGTS